MIKIKDEIKPNVIGLKMVEIMLNMFCFLCLFFCIRYSKRTIKKTGIKHLVT